MLVIGKVRELFGDARQTLLTRDVIKHLRDDENLPFADVNPYSLAALLRPHGIRSKSVRAGADEGKGYQREQFADVFARYLPHDPPKSADTPDTPDTSPSQSQNPVADGTPGPDTPDTPPTHENPDKQGDVSSVAGVSDDLGGVRESTNGGDPDLADLSLDELREHFTGEAS